MDKRSLTFLTRSAIRFGNIIIRQKYNKQKMFFPCFVSKSNINKYATTVSPILSEPYHSSPYAPLPSRKSARPQNMLHFFQ